MRSVFVLFLLVFCFSGFGQIINFPDSNFKIALLYTKCVDTNGDGTGDIDADINNDGEIEISEAETIKFLKLNNQDIKSLEGINYFSSLQDLKCNSNDIASLKIENLPNFISLNCDYNKDLIEIILNNLPSLSFLSCNQTGFTNLEVKDLLTLNTLYCGSDKLINFSLQNLPSLSTLILSKSKINELNLENLPKLSNVDIHHNDSLKTFNVNNLPLLSILKLSYNAIYSLELKDLPSLSIVNSNYNSFLEFFNLSNLPKLTSLQIENNGFTSIEIKDLPSLEILDCSYYKSLATLMLKNLPKLSVLNLTNTSITSMEIKNLPSLTNVDLSSVEPLENLNLINLPKLRDLKITNADLTFLELNDLPSLYFLTIMNCMLLKDIELIRLPKLANINLRFNGLTSLNLDDLANLQDILCWFHSSLKKFTINNCPLVKNIYLHQNAVLSLDIKDLRLLSRFEATFHSDLTEITLQNVPSLKSLYLNSSDLTLINLVTESTLSNLSISDNPNLQFICCSENNLPIIERELFDNDYTNVIVNSYCSFNPFSDYGYVVGNIRFDLNINGCDQFDKNLPLVNLDISGTSGQRKFLLFNENKYKIPLKIGFNKISPVIDNEGFNSIPESITLNIKKGDTITQNFCITPKEPYRQIDITIIPLTPPARPGFDAKYKIIWENKGNLLENGTIHFTYDENIFDYVSADQTPDAINNGKLSWDYTDILPFEKREIIVTLNLNSPMENPPVNAGDITYLYANILDNIFRLENVIVGSYDPNDKTCLQGQYFHPDSVGKYVDFLIRFENTGNYAAENVVIKDIIDDKVFDVSSLQITDASHEMYTRIAGNKVEFIFENIQLPFEDETNDGYVAFKIKTKSTLKLGDEMKNLADIYFDYNFPIRTNETQTSIAIPSGTKDIQTEVTIHPNPVRDVLTLDSSNRWTKAEIFDISGRLIKVTGVDGYSVDVCGLDSGTYILHLSDKDKRARVKFVKM